MTTGFRITKGKGFHITFENGWTVSVQFGRGDYCENKSDLWDPDVSDMIEDDRAAAASGSATAETAVWGPDGHMVEVEWATGDIVQGWQSPADVLRLLTWAAAQPAAVEVSDDR